MRRNLRRALCWLLLAGWLLGCPAVLAETSADALLAQMTLWQKVGQLFIIRPDALDSAQSLDQINDSRASGVTECTPALAEALKAYPVGGIAIFGKNLVSPEQIIAFNQALQAASEVPLFLAVDEEGGLVARLANHAGFELPTYESAAAVGAGGDASAARAMGDTIGAYLRQYGFNMDFAPDADVYTNPANTVIGTRAFSTDAGVAAEMAAAMAEGLREQGVIAVFKHFPGHGDTAEDSHNGLAVSHKTAAELLACEWLPFRAATGRDGVMVGHITVPSIDADAPATLSYQLITGELRGTLGFEGLIITDSLAMGAITKAYGSGKAALLALEAGCDVLLMPNDLQEAYQAIVTAVESGALSEERLDESVRRILYFKAEHGLL